MKKLLFKLFCIFIPSSGLRHIFRFIGMNNKVIFIKDGKTINFLFNLKILKNFKISGYGTNNIIKIHLPANFTNSSINIAGNNCHFEIFPTTRLLDKTTFQLYGNNAQIIIGKDFSSTGNTMILATGNHSVTIGDDTIIAMDTIIQTSDFHTVYDINTKKITNKDSNIAIGKHVWIARRCIILKGASIPNNTIVSAQALVNKKFDEQNTIIAGIPAKIVKNQINWDFNTPEAYKEYFNKS